ncbi:MAG: ankyrin repeat domain-containing protein [Candidatus Aminicenantes bacterium]|nr:ankyrin repeat domain-containing protein [Candidatus Aminicenantes bacterium]
MKKSSVMLAFFLLALPLTAAEIHDAARTGDLARLKTLLESDKTLIALKDGEGRTALHHAAEAGKAAAVEFLLGLGASASAVDAQTRTPLHAAAYKGDAASVKLLLAAGAALEAREIRERTPLYLACHWGNDLETVRLLTAAGADVNDVNPRGEMILFSTLYYGRPEIINHLLDCGARLPEEALQVGTALFISASNGLERVFDLAVEAAEKKNMPWWTIATMHAAARGGSVAVGRRLAAKGAPVDTKNEYGVTPLYIAAENGKSGFVEFLLDGGAKIGETSRTGKTALHIAAENGYSAVADLLRARGANDSPSRFPEFRGPYLDELEPGDTPARFLLGIVSGHGFDNEHAPAVFSPDGNTIFWGSGFGKGILMMTRENGLWTAPRRAPFNSSYGDGEAIFSPDGRRVYFLSKRPIAPGAAPGKENIWRIERTAEGWTEPRPVSAAVNDFEQHWLVSVTKDETLYFSSIRDGGFGNKDLYRARMVDGVHQRPENLGPVINTPGIEHTPFIAPDESYLLFVSTGHPPAEGRSHMFISYRDAAGSWMKPVSLGPKINAVQQGLCPAVTPDGKFMFFIGQGDIWWVSAEFIERLRPATRDR